MSDEENPELTKLWEFFDSIYGDPEDITYEGDHPVRLACMAQNDDEAAVAMFHDAIEDKKATVDQIVGLLGGWGDRRMRAVYCLTRNKETETYAEYIQRIVDSGDGLAMTVKLYDLWDHVDPCRIQNLSKPKLNRYIKAATQILTALHALCF